MNRLPSRKNFITKPWALRMLLALFAAVAAPASAQTTVIHAGHLIAEPGQAAAANQSVVVEEGRIVRIDDGFVSGDKIIDLRDAWVMPGLIDMHVHVYGELDPRVPFQHQLLVATLARPEKMVLQMIPRVGALLDNGFTTVRSMGDQSSTTYALRDAIDEGIVAGPRMLVAEAQISVAGGDLDPSIFGIRPVAEPLVTNRGNCSGVDDCVRAVRSEIRRGADFIKLRQSGLAAEDPKGRAVETAEEIRAIVETAHQLNRRVAAHSNGTPEFLRMVVEAGVDTIEHGPLDEASIALMRRKPGIAYTPTLLAARLIGYRFEEASSNLQRAYEAGVPILFGTDIGIFGPERGHEEFALMAAAGLPAAEVLRSATVNAAKALGRDESIGRIAPGMIADIVAMRVDPLANIGQVGAPDAMVFVMKEGVVHRDEN